MRKYLLMIQIFMAIAIYCNAVGYAEPKRLHGVGAVIYSEDAPLDTLKNAALEQAKENVIGQAGYYIRSYSKSKDNMIDEDEIIPVSSQITKIVNVQYAKTQDINGVWIIQSDIDAEVDSDRLENIRREDIAEILSRYNQLKGEYDIKNSEKGEVSARLESFSLYESGNTYLNNHNYTDAIFAYRKALEINPSLKEAHIGIGNAYGGMRDIEKALGEFDYVLSIDEKNLAAYYGKAKTYAICGELRKALIQYNIVLTLNDSYAPGYRGRGEVYRSMGRYDMAEKDFRAADEKSVNQKI